jgi:hypothetical protein
MDGKKAEEYKGVAEFFKLPVSKPDVQVGQP